MPIYTSPQDTSPLVTAIYEDAPDTPRGASPDFFAGADTGVFRPLLRFDLSTITAGSTCNWATLYLIHSNAADFNTYREHTVYAMRVPWTDLATWNTRDGVNAWGSPGAGSSSADYHPTPIGTFLTPTSANIIAISLDPAVVATWFGSGANNGFIIRNNSEINWTWKQFLSDNHPTATYRPYIVVNWSEASGGSATANGSAVLGQLSSSGTGKVSATGVGNAGLAALSGNGSGKIPSTGLMDATLDAFSASGTGRVTVRGGGLVSLAAVASQGGAMGVAQANGQVLLGYIAPDGQGKVTVQALGLASLEAIEASGTAVGVLAPSSAIGLAAMEAITDHGVASVVAKAMAVATLAAIRTNGESMAVVKASGQASVAVISAQGAVSSGSLPSGAVGYASLETIRSSGQAHALISGNGETLIQLVTSVEAAAVAMARGQALALLGVLLSNGTIVTTSGHEVRGTVASWDLALALVIMQDLALKKASSEDCKIFAMEVEVQ